jgi:hypothetical protein
MKSLISTGHVKGHVPATPRPAKPKPVPPPTAFELVQASRALAGHTKFAADHQKHVKEAEDLGDEEALATHTQMAATHAEGARVAQAVLDRAPKRVPAA